MNNYQTFALFVLPLTIYCAALIIARWSKMMHTGSTALAIQLSAAIKENETLRAELAAANGRASKLDFERTAAELRAEAADARERLKDELLKDTRPFCYGCAYVKDGRLADRYATKKGTEI